MKLDCSFCVFLLPNRQVICLRAVEALLGGLPRGVGCLWASCYCQDIGVLMQPCTCQRELLPTSQGFTLVTALLALLGWQETHSDLWGFRTLLLGQVLPAPFGFAIS